MRFIISVGGVKREVKGGFSICGSKEDLKKLTAQINSGLTEGFGYGWIDIHPDIIDVSPNEQPLGWRDRAFD